MKAHEEFIPWADLDAKLNALEMALNVNDVGVSDPPDDAATGAGYAPVTTLWIGCTWSRSLKQRPLHEDQC